MTDPLIKKYKIKIVSNPTDYLHLIFHGDEGLMLIKSKNNANNTFNARYKPNHKRFDLMIPLDPDNEHFDYSSSIPTSSFNTSNSKEGKDSITFSAIPIPTPLETDRYAASIQDETIYLIPIKSCLEMRPNIENSSLSSREREGKNESGMNHSSMSHSHSQFKDTVAKGKSSGIEKSFTSTSPFNASSHPPFHSPSSQLPVVTGSGGIEGTIEMQIKKKETEQETRARLSSWAHLSKKLEEESWKSLQHYPCNSEESQKVAIKLFSI